MEPLRHGVTHLTVADVGQLELALVLLLPYASIVQVHVAAKPARREAAEKEGSQGVRAN